MQQRIRLANEKVFIEELRLVFMGKDREADTFAT